MKDRGHKVSETNRPWNHNATRELQPHRSWSMYTIVIRIKMNYQMISSMFLHGIAITPIHKHMCVLMSDRTDVADKNSACVHLCCMQTCC